MFGKIHKLLIRNNLVYFEIHWCLAPLSTNQLALSESLLGIVTRPKKHFLISLARRLVKFKIHQPQKILSGTTVIFYYHKETIYLSKENYRQKGISPLGLVIYFQEHSLAKSTTLGQGVQTTIFSSLVKVLRNSSCNIIGRIQH